MNKTNKRSSINKNINALFTCNTCKQSFRHKYNLINHLQSHNGRYKTKQVSHQCKICDVEYCDSYKLLKHIRNTHFNLEGKVSFYRDKLVNETWIERVNHTNVCVEMTKITDNVIAIKKCSQTNCNIAEAGDKMKEQSKLDYSNNVFMQAVCDYCNKGMLRKSLVSHIRERHLNIKPFNCKTCGYSFNRRYQLAKHVCGKYRQKLRKK